MAGEATHPVAKLKESLVNVGRHDRVLALEVRPQRYGFAVLEGSGGLLDWGIRSCGNGRIVRMGGLDSLLESYSPHFVVIRRRKHNSRQAANAVRSVVTRITKEARRFSAQTTFISAKPIRRLFEQYGCTNKHETASALAEWFDEIAWKLPARRRPWQSEKKNTLLFDALATGIAFFARIFDRPTL